VQDKLVGKEVRREEKSKRRDGGKVMERKKHFGGRKRKEIERAG
jgi:hypothetical protein